MTGSGDGQETLQRPSPHVRKGTMQRRLASLLLVSLLPACAPAAGPTAAPSDPEETQQNLAAFDQPAAIPVALQGPFENADEFCGTHLLATPQRGEVTECFLKPILEHGGLLGHGLLVRRADGSSTIHAAFGRDGLILVTDPLVFFGDVQGYSFTGTLYIDFNEQTQRIEINTSQGPTPTEANPTPHVTKTVHACVPASPDLRCTFEPSAYEGSQATSDFNRLVDNLCACGSASSCTNAASSAAHELGEDYWGQIEDSAEVEAAMVRLSMCQPDIYEAALAVE